LFQQLPSLDGGAYGQMVPFCPVHWLAYNLAFSSDFSITSLFYRALEIKVKEFFNTKKFV
jgi:hypothetical protein